MFRHILISRFKSLKEVEFEARRVNVLIGEPNTGKSNVFEALAVFCEALYSSNETLRDSLRFGTMADLFYQFSYLTASETLRRIAFFMAVMETNQGAILLLDEPEANTFPFYTTCLAERIALDETNQFFLTTHNPYVLGPLVAKTPARDLAMFVTTMDAYQTRLTPVTDQGLTRILESGPDAFLNLERLIAA